MKALYATLVLAAQLASLASAQHVRAPIRLMLLDGESAGPYHAWQQTTPVLKKILDDSGLFAVEVVTAPPAGGDFRSFRPDFGKYPVVLFNYDAPDERWPAELKDSFEQYVKGGGGFVCVHASDNAFPDWPAYNLMIGIGGWRKRNETAGPHWFFRNGKLESDISPGPAGRHGKRIPFQIVIRDHNHPVTQGLPNRWMHVGDELYNSMRGPGKNMDILATAYSDPANSGTGLDEPILMALSYGKGRIFHTTLGHDVPAMSGVGFIVTLQRGAEWAGTGQVTQRVPPDFPTADEVRTRPDIAAMAPNPAK